MQGPKGITKFSKTMNIVWVLLTIAVIPVQGQPQPACDSVGDGSPVCSCGPGRVSCKDADLTDVPTDIPPDTDTLELSGNSITSLPAMVFDGLPQLTTLELSDNKISSIEVGAFDGLGSSLEKLDLSNNELVSLEEGMLRNLASLVYLYLKDNKISTVSSGVFDGLSSLIQIFFDGNRISSFPVGVFSGATSLWALELPRNRINRLDNILPSLPFDQIGSLDLSGNNLGSLEPSAFSALSPLSLTTLTLKSCSISVLPEDVFLGLEGLTALYLDDNNLVELRNNSFGTHPSLGILGFSNNKITRIDAGLFSRFPRLAHLELRSNKLASLPPGIFDNLPRLEGLQLGNNTLESLEDPDIFKDLQSLRVLDLQENNLKSLPSGVFSESNLERLKILSLHYNALTEIENGTFDNLPSAEYIYMQYNPLKKVGCGMVPTKDMSPFLETFTISCTCDLEPLFDCPEFAWLGYKTLCLSPIWIWRTPLNYTSPDRWGCGGAGSNHTDWFALAVLLLLSNLFIST